MKKNWRIEEAGHGEPSEYCLIVIDPSAAVDIDGVAECCREMQYPETKKVWIVFDARCSPLQVQATLKVVRDVIPNKEYIIRHADDFIIYLMGQLWRRMQKYCEKRRK